MTTIHELIKFVQLTHRFQNIERNIFVTGKDHNENDAEHSCQLALTAWYLVSSNNLSLDSGKVLKYALAHDLVEAYAGDVPSYQITPEIAAQKKANEAAALERIAAEFPDAHDMLETMHRYEEKADDEARFVYALDKVMPMLNIYLDDGRSWKRDGITFDMLRELKERTTSVSPDIYPYWQELRKILEEKEGELFPPSKHVE
jgi:putative hydrolase of HD superfamily